MRQKIAIVGTGIAGLGAAWALHKDHEITVYEGQPRIGGHSNTVDVDTGDGPSIPVDTGFIVYNEGTYPNLTRLFEHIGVPTQPSDMSFAFSLDRKFEYGASLKGVLANPSNLGKASFRRMLLDINRFRKIGSTLDPLPGEAIDDLLTRYGFSAVFRDDYLFPMTGAIWSARQVDIRRFPAMAILRFLANHGLIEIIGRPKWRTVTGGSREYLTRLIRGFRSRILTGRQVTHVDRSPHRVAVTAAGATHEYDQLILATHSDQALTILGDEATEAEGRLLGSIEYQPNTAMLHSDPGLMPANRRVWASWNAMASGKNREHEAVSITYWMNRLQGLDSTHPLFVSLNPKRSPHPRLIHGIYEYSHPQFSGLGIDAQRAIAARQGENRTFFAGAWMGYGFHEDGLQSGLNVAAALGSPSPWEGSFTPVSSAPAVVRQKEMA